MRLIKLYLVLALSASCAVRVKDIASVEGVRDNQLVGYGLVVGLHGTGDKRQTFFSAQTLANLLDRMGVQVNPAAILVRNTAAVMLTANLPAFAQPGTRIDVQVAAIGDSTNLQGGLLVLTPLKAATGQVYAVAQGSVVTGGFAAGRAGSSTTVNHPTAGRIPAGAIVELTPPSVVPGDHVRLQLHLADFTNASRLAAAANLRFGAQIARCESAGLVAVMIPADWQQRRVEFVAELEALSVERDAPTRIVINERTGTIAAGREIKIRPVAILHGGLSVEVQTTVDVSQPALLAPGKTLAVPQTGVTVKEERAKAIRLRQGATVDDLVKSLTAIGSSARDIIAVLQSLRAAGALDAEIEVL